MRKVRKKLIIEPKEIDNYEVYSDKELARISKEKSDLGKEPVGKLKQKGKIEGVEEIQNYYKKIIK